MINVEAHAAHCPTAKHNDNKLVVCFRPPGMFMGDQR